MADQLKLMVGASGAVLGLVVGIGVGLVINSDGGSGPSQPVTTVVISSSSTTPVPTTTDAPIAAAP